MELDDSQRLWIFLAGTVQQASQTQQGLTQAQQPQSFANYVYDPTTGYYYDSTTGLYYDANTQVILHFVHQLYWLLYNWHVKFITNIIIISFLCKHICHCFPKKALRLIKGDCNVSIFYVIYWGSHINNTQ